MGLKHVSNSVNQSSYCWGKAPRLNRIANPGKGSHVAFGGHHASLSTLTLTTLAEDAYLTPIIVQTTVSHNIWLAEIASRWRQRFISPMTVISYSGSRAGEVGVH
jgi:hypothetical protein